MKKLSNIIGFVLCFVLLTAALCACGKEKNETSPEEKKDTPEEKKSAQYVMPDVRGIYYIDGVEMIEEGLKAAGFKEYEVHYAWTWDNSDPEMNAKILDSNPNPGTVITDNGDKVQIILTAAEAARDVKDPEKPDPKDKGTEKVLVVYFSETGNTKKVAEMIAKIENADLYEIVPAEPYSEEDIDYTNSRCRALREQYDDSSRPAIASDPVDLAEYTKVYVGYPIWAGKEPRIMDTFVESIQSGSMSVTVIPFCTSGSSGIGKTGTNLASLASFGDWKDGKRFPGNATEADVQKWIDSMK